VRGINSRHNAASFRSRATVTPSGRRNGSRNDATTLPSGIARNVSTSGGLRASNASERASTASRGANVAPAAA
jgi:hypothetical protein